MRGGRNNFNGEWRIEWDLGIWKLVSSFLDRGGGGNRGRYGNFSDDNNREEGGFSGGRQNYGHRDGNYGNREERGYNNYGNRGNRGAGGGGGGAGGGYEQERRTSESMSSLSLEGKQNLLNYWRNLQLKQLILSRTGRWSTEIEVGSSHC